MSLKITRPGLMTTIQDLGRYGYQKIGVLVSGAMDGYSLRIANILVGNPEDTGALEITLTGPTIEFTANTLIAITGGDLQPVMDGWPVKLWRPVAVKAGSVLRFKGARTGSRCYLAVAGGFEVPRVMGSQSTYLRAAIGGFQGRALAAGDVLETGVPNDYANQMMRQLLSHGARSFMAAKWGVGVTHTTADKLARPIRITKGLQFAAFKEKSKNALTNEGFKITTKADRMGYRLQGPKLELAQPLEMISEAAALGTIQVPPDGNPIVLLADHQGVAGYPKIAQVCAVDVARLAQYKPGDVVRFELIPLEEAERLYLEKEKYMENVKIAVAGKLQ
jgi:antagonist of KipI